MATVCLCTDSRDNQLVAVKILRPEYAGALAAERFLREVAFVSSMDHPRILKVIESGVTAAIAVIARAPRPNERKRLLI